MLRELRVSGYRSLRDVSLELSQRVDALLKKRARTA